MKMVSQSGKVAIKRLLMSAGLGQGAYSRLHSEGFSFTTKPFASC